MQWLFFFFYSFGVLMVKAICMFRVIFCFFFPLSLSTFITLENTFLIFPSMTLFNCYLGLQGFVQKWLKKWQRSKAAIEMHCIRRWCVEWSQSWQQCKKDAVIDLSVKNRMCECISEKKQKLRICFLLSQLQRLITRKVGTIWTDSGRSWHKISCKPRF